MDLGYRGCGRNRAATMPGFYKAAAIVMSGGAFVGASVLMMLPSPPEDTLPSSPVFATAMIADLFPEPCKQQLWLNTLNTDRVCQTWSLPDRDVERILSAPEPATKATKASRQPTGQAATERPSTKSEVAAKDRGRSSRTADNRARVTRENGSHRIPPPGASSPTAEGVRRAGFPG
jgi:hypothetical protein